MLSSRGAQTIDLALQEALARPVNGGRLLPLTEAQRVWAAASAIIRTQLLLGNPITIPKVASFWTRQRHVASDGPVHYFVRSVRIGFSPSFVSTYTLDSRVPVEDLRLRYTRIPVDVVAQEARVPADVCADVLRELFRFIGEGIYNGRVFSLAFPDVCEIHVKREKAVITVDAGLSQNLFDIDSRKWPIGIREMAALHIAKTASAGSRPASASSSRPPSSRAGFASRGGSAGGQQQRLPSASAAAPPTAENLLPRPLFVNALPRDRNFDEIRDTPVRAIRHRPVVPGAKGRAARAVKEDPSMQVHVDPLSPRALTAPTESESVYDVLSPSRRIDDDELPPPSPYCPPRAPQERLEAEVDVALEAVPPPTTNPLVLRSAAAANQLPAPAAAKASTIFPWETAEGETAASAPVAPAHYGRRRYGQSTPTDNVASLIAM